jgi:hypothetical protein
MASSLASQALRISGFMEAKAVKPKAREESQALLTIIMNPCSELNRYEHFRPSKNG